MPDTAPIVAETVLEVVSPDGARRYIRVTQSPFLIGRGAEAGNHLQLSADKRISRNCAAIVVEANKRYIEDRGRSLAKLDQLLAATALLHSQLPLDEVLGMMLDHAVSVMDADRGVLLEADDKGALHVRLARRSGGLRLPPESLAT